MFSCLTLTFVRFDLTYYLGVTYFYPNNIDGTAYIGI